MKATRSCSVAGCVKSARTRGWCSAHYERHRLHGTVGTAPVRHFHPDREACSVDGCDRPYAGSGFCKLHHRRWNTHGNPLHVEIQGVGPAANAWKGDDVTYAGAHGRIYRTRGAATGYSCADGCGRQADDWAYDHGDLNELTEDVGGYPLPYSVDPARYRPMCKFCHKAFDLGRKT